MYKGYTPSPLWRLLSRMDDTEGTDQEVLMSQDERTYGPSGQGQGQGHRSRSPPLPGSPTLSPDFHSHLHNAFHNKQQTLGAVGPEHHHHHHHNKRSRSPSRSPRPSSMRHYRERSRSPRPSSLRDRDRTSELSSLSRSASYRDHRRSSAERRPSQNPSPASSFGATSPNPSPRGSLLEHSPDHQLNKWTSRGSIRKSPRGSVRRYSAGRGQTWHKRLHSSDKWQSSFRNANPYMTQGFAQSYRAPAIEILMGSLIFISGLVLLIIGFCVGDETWMYISAGCCGVGIMFIILGCCWYRFLDTKELGSSKKKNPEDVEDGVGEAHPGQLDKPRDTPDVEDIVEERRPR